MTTVLRFDEIKEPWEKRKLARLILENNVVFRDSKEPRTKEAVIRVSHVSSIKKKQPYSEIGPRLYDYQLSESPKKKIQAKGATKGGKDTTRNIRGERSGQSFGESNGHGKIRSTSSFNRNLSPERKNIRRKSPETLRESQNQRRDRDTEIQKGNGSSKKKGTVSVLKEIPETTFDFKHNGVESYGKKREVGSQEEAEMISKEGLQRDVLELLYEEKRKEKRRASVAKELQILNLALKDPELPQENKKRIMALIQKAQKMIDGEPERETQEESKGKRKKEETQRKTNGEGEKESQEEPKGRRKEKTQKNDEMKEALAEIGQNRSKKDSVLSKISIRLQSFEKFDTEETPQRKGTNPIGDKGEREEEKETQGNWMDLLGAAKKGKTHKINEEFKKSDDEKPGLKGKNIPVRVAFDDPAKPKEQKTKKDFSKSKTLVETLKGTKGNPKNDKPKPMLNKKGLSRMMTAVKEFYNFDEVTENLSETKGISITMSKEEENKLGLVEDQEDDDEDEDPPGNFQSEREYIDLDLEEENRPSEEEEEEGNPWEGPRGNNFEKLRNLKNKNQEELSGTGGPEEENQEEQLLEGENIGNADEGEESERNQSMKEYVEKTLDQKVKNKLKERFLLIKDQFEKESDGDAHVNIQEARGSQKQEEKVREKLKKKLEERSEQMRQAQEKQSIGDKRESQKHKDKREVPFTFAKSQRESKEQKSIEEEQIEEFQEEKKEKEEHLIHNQAQREKNVDERGLEVSKKEEERLEDPLEAKPADKMGWGWSRAKEVLKNNRALEKNSEEEKPKSKSTEKGSGVFFNEVERVFMDLLKKQFPKPNEFKGNPSKEYKKSIMLLNEKLDDLSSGDFVILQQFIKNRAGGSFFKYIGKN